MRSLVVDDSPDMSPAAAFVRLMWFPALVGLLFVGGVYWLRVELASAGGTPEQTTLVQVHLLPRPDPLPIPVNSAVQSTAVVPPSPVRGSTEAPASLSSEILAALPTEDVAPSDPPLPSAGLRDAPEPVPNSARMTFRSELARHIARFQRYPKAGERQGLQGTVRTVFTISRNGKLLGVWVKTSSGQSVLDQAALDTIRRAQPLPTIPPALPDTLKVEVALGFDPS